jgi:hypothetical protein
MNIDSRTASPIDVVRSAREAAAAATQAQATAPTQEGKGGATPVAFATVKAGTGANSGVIYGVAASVNVDLDNEQLEQPSLMSFAHDFVASTKRTFKANHTEYVKVQLAESWTGIPLIQDGETVRALKAGEVLDPKAEVVGISFKGEPTHWFIGIKPDDASIIEAHKAGELVGFSWGAFVQKQVA